MKTRNAFALRDFDAELILQRKIFVSEFGTLDDNADSEILDSLFNVAAISHSGTNKMRQRLKDTKRLKATAEKFANHLLKHELKIEKYLEREETKDRAAFLKQSYQAAIESVGSLQRKINQLISEGEKAIAKIFCKELGERIRTAREALSLERKDVAAELGISLYALGYYERGDREISPYHLRRLSEILGRSPNWLFGY